jgi:hypothetical protein
MPKIAKDKPVMTNGLTSQSSSAGAQEPPLPEPVSQISYPAGFVLDRIGPISFPEGESITILVYGRSATGKTWFWGTFPGPILVVVCSGSFKPGELRTLNTPELRRKISQVVLRESSEMKTILDYVATTQKYKTVVLDHVSGLEDLVLKELLGLHELPAQKYFGMAKRETYGQVTQMCKEYVRGMLNLPNCNVVIVGQERNFNTDMSKADMLDPAIGVGVTPSLAGWLQPVCDYVVQTLIRPKVVKMVTDISGEKVTTEQRVPGQVDFAIRTHRHDVIATKFRVPKGHLLPDFITDPSYEKLMAAIRGEPVEGAVILNPAQTTSVPTTATPST